MAYCRLLIEGMAEPGSTAVQSAKRLARGTGEGAVGESTFPRLTVFKQTRAMRADRLYRRWPVVNHQAGVNAVQTPR